MLTSFETGNDCSWKIIVFSVISICNWDMLRFETVLFAAISGSHSGNKSPRLFPLIKLGISASFNTRAPIASQLQSALQHYGRLRARKLAAGEQRPIARNLPPEVAVATEEETAIRTKLEVSGSTAVIPLYLLRGKFPAHFDAGSEAPVTQPPAPPPPLGGPPEDPPRSDSSQAAADATLAELLAMGFDYERCRSALQLADGNPQVTAPFCTCLPRCRVL